MAYDEDLAARIRELLEARPNYVEKRMFGGLAFLLHGHMCVGIWQNQLIARVGPEQYADALAEPLVREFDITGKPMKGWVMVDPDALDEDAQLRQWIDRAERFVATLPAK